ncbi:MAG: hypothetical protein SFT81_04980 [Candidatus Caenarcaniphilales bacterium]|nr:hypothetical protein [Candidatus Caenarcaniphilales bacterium]
MGYGANTTSSISSILQRSETIFGQTMNDTHLSPEPGEVTRNKNLIFAHAVKLFDLLASKTDRSKVKPILVLNGDILEFLNTKIWHEHGIKPFDASLDQLKLIATEILQSIALQNREAFQALKSLSRRCLIIFIEGNHDHLLFQAPGLKELLAKMLDRTINRSIFFLPELRSGKAVFIQHGYQGDPFHTLDSEEMAQAFTVILYGSFPARLKEEFQARSIPPDLQANILTALDQVERVYPRYLIVNWLQREVDRLIATISSAKLRDDCKKAIYNAWNRGWDELSEEKQVKQYFDAHPWKKFLTFQLGYNHLGGWISRFFRKIGELASRLTPMETAQGIFDEHLKKMAKESKAALIEVGHFHGGEEIIQSISANGIQILAKATFVPTPIAPIETKNNPHLKSYLSHFAPFSVLQFLIRQNASFNQAKVRVVHILERLSPQSPLIGLTGALASNPTVSPTIDRSDENWLAEKT